LSVSHGHPPASPVDNRQRIGARRPRRGLGPRSGHRGGVGGRAGIEVGGTWPGRGIRGGRRGDRATRAWNAGCGRYCSNAAWDEPPAWWAELAARNAAASCPAGVLDGDSPGPPHPPAAARDEKPTNQQKASSKHQHQTVTQNAIASYSTPNVSNRVKPVPLLRRDPVPAALRDERPRSAVRRGGISPVIVAACDTCSRNDCA
jgi:hypothetical protein